MTADGTVSSQLGAAGIWVAAIGIVGLVIRQVIPWRKQADGAQEQFRAELMAREIVLTDRIETLERRLERQQTQLERQQSRHGAERSLDRHRLNNITQCFDALLLLIETSPEKATEIVTKIKEMRATQIKAEAEEKAIISAAEINGEPNELPEGDTQ